MGWKPASFTSMPTSVNFSSWQDYTSVSMTVGSDQETCSLVTVFCWLQ
jgi:hypothetical protein